MRADGNTQRMDAVIPSSLLGLLILVGVVGVVVFVLTLMVNSWVVRRLKAGSLDKRRPMDAPANQQAWREAGRRAATPTSSEIEGQFGSTEKRPPVDDQS